ncbi:polysaccharide deacetylase family protein [Salirhabdus salicampi]|uniref:polysaccharide deacetylase family protein n=1 Tax=Salirhabdus salicampi TaxID=476102 RepID=UPI0020C4872F|nr:polysaccharide deacetylase family protein [Salirhabdus salicampi]MCP8616067.1 polysaccharide deacetylase family protein [Salirhabdus salicampi]
MRQFICLIIIATIMAGCSKNSDNLDGDTQVGQEPEEQTKPDVNQNDEEVNEPEEDVDENGIEEEEMKSPLYEVSNVWSIKPMEEDVAHNVVLMTIDDAPDKYSLEMAKTLKNLDVKAIFFVNGIFIEKGDGREQLKQIAELGFEIGNHTYGHTRLDTISEEEQYEEIMKNSDLIEDITGERPKFFRAPHGVNTDYAKNLVKEEGMALMNWSFGYDFMADYMTKEAIADIMVNTELLSNGANLLMHDREWTYEALEEIVTGIQDKGFQFVDPDLIQTP